MTGRGEPSLAARSGRGGTTGRAIGWPARGRVEGLAGGAGRGAKGRGIAGVALRGPSEGTEGNGARGPDSTWPGRGP